MLHKSALVNLWLPALIWWCADRLGSLAPLGNYEVEPNYEAERQQVLEPACTVEVSTPKLGMDLVEHRGVDRSRFLAIASVSDTEMQEEYPALRSGLMLCAINGRSTIGVSTKETARRLKGVVGGETRPLTLSFAEPPK